MNESIKHLWRSVEDRKHPFCGKMWNEVMHIKHLIVSIPYYKCKNCQLLLWLLFIYALISHASKVMLKILQARLQLYMNHELPDVQAGFRKGRGPRDQIANIHWIIKKAREFKKKTYISASLTMPRPLTVWITINYGKFWKRWEYQTTWPASWETYMQVRKQHLELDMEQQTGSK